MRFKGTQELDDNVKIILEWMEVYNLIMLNNDFECSGEVMWRRNNQESTVDYMLITQQLYKEYESMKT